MLKLVGIVLIIAGCTGVGVAYKQQLEERLWHLRQMRQVFVLISSSVRYDKATLPESCRQAAKKVKAPYNTALQEIYQIMKENKGLPFALVWKQEIGKRVRGLPISTKEKELFLQSGAGSGYLDNCMQQQAMNRHIQELEQYIGDLEKNIKEKSKVAVCLGIMGGMFLTIALL